jgi:hypothetical protein
MFVQNAWQRLPALIPVVLLSLAFPPAPRRIAPQFTFGSRREKVSKRDSTPAPGVYKTEGAMGPQHMSNRTNASAISFGESKRPPLSLTSTTVGPGEVCAHASYLTPPPAPSMQTPIITPLAPSLLAPAAAAPAVRAEINHGNSERFHHPQQTNVLVRQRAKT